MINRLNFSIDIKASKASIWKALWDEQAYKEWASVFFEGSCIVTDKLGEGSIVHFLGPDKNGIYSIIEEHIPNHIIRFKHIGSVVAGEEQELDDETKVWSGCTEIYKLTELDDAVKLEVALDVQQEHLEFMTNTFPKALEKIRENSK